MEQKYMGRSITNADFLLGIIREWKTTTKKEEFISNLKIDDKVDTAKKYK